MAGQRLPSGYILTSEPFDIGPKWSSTESNHTPPN